jgi:hypothetical protein
MKTAALSILAALVLGVCAFAFAESPPVVEVWRTASCGCCGAWVKHLQENGFATRVHFVDDTAAARRQAGMPEAYGSCHTAKVGGYAVEGHVPAAEIRRLLAQKPRAVGLSVPGMPLGSPGMEGPAKMPYDVMLVGGDGKASVYRHY